MKINSIDQFRLMGPNDRTAIYGRTGSGKTVLANWVLSHQAFDRMPWYVVDYKGDQLLRSISRMKHVPLTDKITKHPGLYRVTPLPEIDDKTVENFLWRVWKQRNVGIYVDEGYMLPNNSGAYNTILTQGRSLHIPVINLTQRPVWMSRFVPSQSDFHFLFPFSDDDDNKTALRFMDKEIRDHMREGHLPEYHSYWHDVAKHRWGVIGAAPDPDIIRQQIDERLRPEKTRI